MKASIGIWVAAILLVLYVTFGLAQPSTPVQKAPQLGSQFQLAPGVWYATAQMKVTVAADGSFVSEIVGPMVVTGTTRPPDVPDGPDPPPEVDQLRAQIIELTDAVVDSNKANTMKALSKLYLSTGTLPLETSNQLTRATNILFGAMGLPESWQTWKAGIDALTEGYDLDKAKSAWTIISEVLDG